MNDKFKIVLGFFILAMVIATILMWVLNAEMNLFLLATMGIITVIIVLAAWILLRKATAIKAGLPAEDELSKKVTHKAGYYAYVASMWVLIGAMLGNMLLPEPLQSEHVIPAVVLISGAVFVLSAWRFMTKGNVGE